MVVRERGKTRSGALAARPGPRAGGGLWRLGELGPRGFGD